MGYFSQLDSRLRADGVATPVMRQQRYDGKPDAYLRDGDVICVPCSDIEDREHPFHATLWDICSICGEPIR